MPSPYTVLISDGTGNAQVLNGSYTVTANATGYNNTSILPATVNVVSGTDTYPFTIAATGVLTLHVTDTGTVGGTNLAGAKFKRCDATGVEYGAEITSDANGDAVFEFMPFAPTGSPVIYYKQTGAVADHEPVSGIQNTTMTTELETVQVMNGPAANRAFTLVDINYDSMPIGTASIILT